MARHWITVIALEAEKHRLYGIKNWLAVFALFFIIVLLQEILAIDEAGLTFKSIIASTDPKLVLAKFVIAVEIAATVIIAYFLFTKHERLVASCVLIGIWPILFVVSALVSPASVGGIIKSFIGSFVWIIVWVIYLNRSQRVRVTYEHKILGQAVASEPDQPAQP